MTCKISRPLFAMLLALGMLAAISNPGHAALSTADRTNAAATPAPVTLAVAAPAEAVATPVATPVAPVATAAAPAATDAAPAASQPRKAVTYTAKPQRFAAVRRAGYPCH